VEQDGAFGGRCGAITPDGIIDEDFEEALGSPSQVIGTRIGTGTVIDRSTNFIHVLKIFFVQFISRKMPKTGLVMVNETFLSY